MKKGLYDAFAHWYCDGGVYFYGDPHFGDEFMNESRGITDEEQIKSINSVIGKNDTLVILGDVGNIECVKKLRGYKVLITGNHDLGASRYKRHDFYGDDYETRQEAFDAGSKNKNFEYVCECHSCLLNSDSDDRKDIYIPFYDNHLFDEVYEGTLIIGKKILLSHEPVNYPYCYNIHGHDHSNWFHIQQGMNVCAEVINYKPVSLKSIIQSGALKNILDVHRETIDRAADR